MMEAEAPAAMVVHGDTTWHALVPRLLQAHESKTVAEVGVWRGELSAKILRECVQVRKLILVDSWTVVYGHDPDHDKWVVFGPGTTQEEMNESYRLVMERFQYFGDRVVMHKLPSVDGAKLVADRSLDAVMIDALHTYHACKEDILTWLPKVKVGGLIIGDDHSEWFPGVQVAVEELFGSSHCVLGQTWWKVVEEADYVRIAGNTD